MRPQTAWTAPLVASLLTLALGAISCAEGAPVGPPPVGLTVGGANGEGGAGGANMGGDTQGGSLGAAGDSANNAGGSGGGIVAGAGGAASGTDAMTAGSAGSSGSGGSVGGSDAGSPDACTSTADRDQDGHPDCVDACPDDPTKSQPGKCGCGVSEADRDNDNTPDCLDACADDPAKTQPGACGCGTPESCVDLKNALVHRYRFVGSGMQATDSVGTAHGTIMNASLSGSGTLVLAGAQTDQYVDLPNNIIHTLTNATFEAWITWQGGNAWQRIFDFGDELTQTENAQGTGRSYLFLSATTGGTNGVIRTAYQKAGSPETIVNSIKPLPTGAIAHVAVVADDQNNKLLLYLNGSLEASSAWNDSLSLIHDINVWLGRSQYAGDSELGATYHEFRIYNVALSPALIAASAKAGPDPAFLN